MSKPDCYTCGYRRDVPDSAHSSCAHPEVASVTSDPESRVWATLGSVGRGPGLYIRALNVEANSHGVRRGWFNWPLNYDPVWLTRCDGYTPKEEKVLDVTP